MASASIHFFMKDADVVKDADADQCKRTLTRHGQNGRRHAKNCNIIVASVTILLSLYNKYSATVSKKFYLYHLNCAHTGPRYWGRFKNAYELLNLRALKLSKFCIKIVSYNVWVRYFVWNFKHISVFETPPDSYRQMWKFPLHTSTQLWHWLTHWGRDKMDAISQTTCSSGFYWMKMFEFRLKFHWSLFLRVQLTIILHCFR